MKIAIGSKIVQGPWGGGNLFTVSLKKYLQEKQVKVSHNLVEKDIDIILLTEPRIDSSTSTITLLEAKLYKRFVNKNVKIVHRINECDERKGTNYELDIYGEGSLKNELKKLSQELNVTVNFLGIVNNETLVEKLQNYKFYISSSVYEGNPKSVLEAMSAGCIVIASKIKNHLEFLNNNNSILFDNNITSLNEAIMHLDKISQTRNDDLVNNSLETINNKYNLNDLVKKEIKDINNLVM